MVALSVIFLINFAIISLLSGVDPSCYYHYDDCPWCSQERGAINVWEGLWIPIPSFVTGIVGRKYQMLKNRKKKHVCFQDWRLPVVQASARRFFYWSCPSSPLSSTSVHLPHLLCPFLTLSLMTDTTLAVTVLNSCNDRATFWSRWVSSSSFPPPPSPYPYSPACTNLPWKPTKVN